jgi:acyl carrier protein
MPDSLRILRQFFAGEKLVPQANAGELDENMSLLDSALIDSLNILRLVVFIEENFGVKIGDEELIPENFENLKTIVNLINKKTL